MCTNRPLPFAFRTRAKPNPLKSDLKYEGINFQIFSFKSHPSLIFQSDLDSPPNNSVNSQQKTASLQTLRPGSSLAINHTQQSLIRIFSNCVSKHMMFPKYPSLQNFILNLFFLLILPFKNS